MTYREADESAPTARPDSRPRKYVVRATLVVTRDVGEHRNWKAARDAALRKLAGEFGVVEIAEVEVEAR